MDGRYRWWEMEGGTALPIGQVHVHVSFKRLLAWKRNYSSQTTRWDFFEPCIRTNQINDSKELEKSLSFLHDIFLSYLFLHRFKMSCCSSADQNIFIYKLEVL